MARAQVKETGAPAFIFMKHDFLAIRCRFMPHRNGGGVISWGLMPNKESSGSPICKIHKLVQTDPTYSWAGSGEKSAKNM